MRGVTRSATAGMALMLLLAAAALAAVPAAPESAPESAPVATHPGLHPAFELRDARDEVLSPAAVTAGADVSAHATCGACHDADFIAAHDTHGASAPEPARRARMQALDIDCFTCHVPAGVQALAAAVETTRADGKVHVQMGPPNPEACGQCHGAVERGEDPFVFDAAAYLAGEPSGPYDQTHATGVVFSPQQVGRSYLNLADKPTLTRAWDVHAARGLGCASCHVAPNDPASAGLVRKPGQAHLRRDPRTLTMDSYLARPDHRLVSVDCVACHDPAATHDLLPSRARHMEALACQACHVPHVPTPTPRAIDRTVVTAAGGPRLELRGVVERAWDHQPSTWYSQGYRPVLLAEPADSAAISTTRLAPHNVQAEWRWVDRARDQAAVPADLVRQAWLDADGAHHAVLLDLFDRDADGVLADGELVLDSEARVAIIRERLVHLGVGEPAIVGELVVHPVRHGVVDGEHALRDCQACHAPDSRLTMAMAVATGPLPGGVMPVASAAARERLGGRDLEMLAGGVLRLSTGTLPPDRHVLGQARSWSDALGLLVLAATLLGIAAHAGLRIRAARRHAVHVAAPTARVYMYGAYERVWHWLMAFSVLLLLVTGFRIHFPASLPFLGYPTAVFLHDIVAAVFIVNAFLSFFYHVTTAEIRQFIPAGAGLFERLAVQARYYVQGIFQRAAHPLAKTPDAKLNPLQQVTYFGLLNVLFPLQIVTGALMWVGGRWPELTAPVGGLAIVAPVHNLGSWLFLTFLVMHVYLTTTGHTLTSNLKAMVDGWDEVEAEPAAARAVVSQPRGVEHV